MKTTTYLADKLALDVVLRRDVAAELDSKVRRKDFDVAPKNLPQLTLLPDIECSLLLQNPTLHLERVGILGAVEPSAGIRKVVSEVRDDVGRHAFELGACVGRREEERGTE